MAWQDAENLSGWDRLGMGLAAAGGIDANKIRGDNLLKKESLEQKKRDMQADADKWKNELKVKLGTAGFIQATGQNPDISLDGGLGGYSRDPNAPKNMLDISQANMFNNFTGNNQQEGLPEMPEFSWTDVEGYNPEKGFFPDRQTLQFSPSEKRYYMVDRGNE